MYALSLFWSAVGLAPPATYSAACVGSHSSRSRESSTSSFESTMTESLQSVLSMPRQARTESVDVTIIDRRAGKTVAKRAFPAPKPISCPAKLEDVVGATGKEWVFHPEWQAIDDYVASFVKP